MTAPDTAGTADLSAVLAAHDLHDLTLTVAEDLPCWWPTHLPFQHKTFNYFADRPDAAAPLLSRCGPYQTRWLAIDEHTGTHVDAPSHFIPPAGSDLPHAGPTGDTSAEALALDQLLGPAAVIDVPGDLPGGEPGVSPFIPPEVVTAWEATNGAIEEDTVVLFRTGWDARYVAGAAGTRYLFDVLITRTEPGWPAPSPATIELLVSRGARCLGTDAPSMGAAHDGQPAHVVGLGAGAVFVEALTGLSPLPARGAHFVFLPIKVRHGSGAPGRALAFVPRTQKSAGTERRG